MKVLVTCLYDAKDEKDARELSKLFPHSDVLSSTYTMDFLKSTGKEYLAEVARSAGIAQFRATEPTRTARENTFNL